MEREIQIKKYFSFDLNISSTQYVNLQLSSTTIIVLVESVNDWLYLCHIYHFTAIRTNPFYKISQIKHLLLTMIATKEH